MMTENSFERVAVVGLGYVGLPLTVAFGEAGIQVLGLDVDPNLVERLQQGKSHIDDIPDQRVERLIEKGRFRATTESRQLRKAEAVILCVPTPLSTTGDPDLSYILSAAREVSQHLQPGQLVVLESTTYPGTTEEVLAPELEADRYTVGEDFYLAFSPERVDPGNPQYDITNTPKVVGGMTPECLKQAQTLYEQICEEVVPVSSPAVAELTKLHENMYRAINIGLANELARICGRLEINVHEVVEAASTKPFGFQRFDPGPGIGGHCIPVDPHYLSWKMRTLELKAEFVDLADEVNSSMPEYVAQRTIKALNDQGLPTRGAQILLLGVAYKPGVSDVRESPAFDVIKILQNWGAELTYHDPHVPQLTLAEDTLTHQPLDAEMLDQQDAAIVITDHPEIDWPLVAQQANLVIDTREALSQFQPSGTVYPLSGPPKT